MGFFVNFFRSPCNFAFPVVRYCVACYIFLCEVISLQTHYGHLARVLHSCTDQAITNALAQMELTSAQGHIVGFITHREQPPCARDIEEAFQLSHATVSGLLSRLEKKGFIEFRSDEADRRCKRIHILPKAKELEQTMHRTIRANEERMVQDFTEEEKQLFSQLLHRAIRNMGESPCKRKSKEERKP